MTCCRRNNLRKMIFFSILVGNFILMPNMYRGGKFHDIVGGQWMICQIEVVLEVPKQNKINQSMGSVLHGLLMEIVGRETAEWLHSMNSLRPFSQSTYYHKARKCQIWRINTLTEEAYIKIIEPVLSKIGMELYCRQKKYSILLAAVLREKKISYQELVQHNMDAIPSAGKIKILTTTSFKHNGKYVMIPDLRMLYQSIIARWNVFGGSDVLEMENLEERLSQASEFIWYQLSSKLFGIERVNINGFVGEIYLKLPKDKELVQAAGILIEYAKFCGIGIKNALGMGAVDTALEYGRMRRK